MYLLNLILFAMQYDHVKQDCPHFLLNVSFRHCTCSCFYCWRFARRWDCNCSGQQEGNATSCCSSCACLPGPSSCSGWLRKG
ncbi:hypothetical protein BDQ17DRAFT_1384573, partial [Cyathus striatus]